MVTFLIRAANICSLLFVIVFILNFVMKAEYGCLIATFHAHSLLVKDILLTLMVTRVEIILYVMF